MFEIPCEMVVGLFVLLWVLLASGSSQVTMDFVADVGDGWEPSFAIAASLAQPELVITKVTCALRILARFPSRSLIAPKRFQPHCAFFWSVKYCTYVSVPLESPILLKRATTLINGGDLCYPEPSPETWLRFELPFTLSLASRNVTVALRAANAQNEPMVDWLSFARFRTLWLEIIAQVFGSRSYISGPELPGTTNDRDALGESFLDLAEPSVTPQMLVIPGNHDILGDLAVSGDSFERISPFI